MTSATNWAAIAPEASPNPGQLDRRDDEPRGQDAGPWLAVAAVDRQPVLSCGHSCGRPGLAEHARRPGDPARYQARSQITPGDCGCAGPTTCDSRQSIRLCPEVGQSAGDRAPVRPARRGGRADSAVGARNGRRSLDDAAGGVAFGRSWRCVAMDPAGCRQCREPGCECGSRRANGYGSVIAAWLSFALIGSYELLIRQIRAAGHEVGPQRPARSTEQSKADSAQIARRPPSAVPGFSRTDQGSKQLAWEWALDHFDADGSLPSGRAIADQFGRHERGDG